LEVFGAVGGERSPWGFSVASSLDFSVEIGMPRPLPFRFRLCSSSAEPLSSPRSLSVSGGRIVQSILLGWLWKGWLVEALP
jgi:hypothetical protein